MAHAAVDLACAQAQLGHKVAICHGGGDFNDIFASNGVEVYTMPSIQKSPKIFRSAVELARVVHRFKPDVVHAHMVASAMLAWPITRLARVPLITCIQNSFSRNAKLMKIGDRVITGCNAVSLSMVARGVSREKLRPVLNGTIGSARQFLRDEENAILQRPAVITMCGLHPRKGVADLIAAFALVHSQRPDAHLYIVGEGPYETDYKSYVAERSIKNVHFVGALKDPRPYLKGADVFVLASHADPAPLAIIEAREAGLAVIGTDVDGIPELLDNGKAGILVSPRSPGELGKKIAALLLDDNKLEIWRKRSQCRISYLTVSRVAEETVQVYQECL